MTGFRTHFTLKHRAVAFASTRLFNNFTYTIRHGLAAGMRRKGGLGFLPFKSDESEESRFLSELRLHGKTVYDIGGFEGVLTLFFASKAGAVITYEPNPRNYQRCLDNVKLNSLTNVRVLNRGLSDGRGVMELVFDPLMPGAGSGNENVAHQITGSIAGARTIEVPVSTLDEDVNELQLPAPHLIKIDIEGMEAVALRGMKNTLERHRPDLFIELHGAERDDKIRIAVATMEYLMAAGYRIYDVENRADVTAPVFTGLPPSHIYCTKEGSRLTSE